MNFCHDLLIASAISGGIPHGHVDTSLGTEMYDSFTVQSMVDGYRYTQMHLV